MNHFIRVSLVILGMGTLCFGEKFIPDAPVIDFKIPVFGKNGYRSWYLQGDKAEYVEEGQFFVTDMKIKVFRGEKGDKVESTIRSNSARIFIEEKRALGEEMLEIQGDNYRVEGGKWEWFGAQKKMLIKDKVHVVFKDSLKEALGV